LTIPPEKLLNNLSYSHLEQLINIDEEIKRTFYEIECIRGNWSGPEDRIGAALRVADPVNGETLFRVNLCSL